MIMLRMLTIGGKATVLAFPLDNDTQQGNVSDLYPERERFESQSGHRLS
jgi:hypothetical protein